MNVNKNSTTLWKFTYTGFQTYLTLFYGIVETSMVIGVYKQSRIRTKCCLMFEISFQFKIHVLRVYVLLKYIINLY